MPLQDQTDYYSGVIDSGQWELTTVEDAAQVVDDLIDRLKTDVAFNREEIAHYAAVDDEIEGFIYLNPDILESQIYSSVSDVYYIKAIMQKFPALQADYDSDSVEEVIALMEEAQSIADGIGGDNISDHLKWKDQILKAFAKAESAARSI